MAETTHGKYTLRRRDNLPDYELFQADFDSDIDSEVEDNDEIGVEISDEAFPDESNIDFVDETVAVRDVVETETTLLSVLQVEKNGIIILFLVGGMIETGLMVI